MDKNMQDSKQGKAKFEKACPKCGKVLFSQSAFNGHAPLCGKPAWNRGIPQTEAQRRVNSESHKGKVAWNKGKPWSKATKKKMSVAKLGKIHEQIFGVEGAKERKIKQAASMREVWSDPEYHDRVSAKATGVIKKQRTGKTLEQIYGPKKAKGIRDAIEVIASGRRGKTMEELYGKKKAKEMQKKQSTANSGSGNPSYGKHPKKSTLKKKSKAMKARWQEAEFVQKQMKARGVKPNKAELKFAGLLNTWFPGVFKFVGDGQVILAGKCPDFINTNGKKQLIELYGNYWHRGQNPQERINLFAQFGYDTLVIWERELKDLEALGQKILAFTACDQEEG